MTPEEANAHVLKLGRAEWGATKTLTREEYLELQGKTFDATVEAFDIKEPTPLHAVYLGNTNVVLCFTGTGPNAGKTASIITGLWNNFLEHAQAEEERNKPKPEREDWWPEGATRCYCDDGLVGERETCQICDGYGYRVLSDAED